MNNFSNYWSTIKGKILIGLGIFLGVALLSFWIWYANWVNFVENYEYGFTYCKFTGKIEKVPHTGWVVATPWEYDVHKIDLRPYQVSISANSRILNAKLVSFNPKGLETFIEWHGRAAGDNLANLQEILKCYAFDMDDGKDCPFLSIDGALAPKQGIQKNTDTTSVTK